MLDAEVLVTVPVVVPVVVPAVVVSVAVAAVVESLPPPHAINPSPVRKVATSSASGAQQWLRERALKAFISFRCWLC